MKLRDLRRSFRNTPSLIAPEAIGTAQSAEEAPRYSNGIAVRFPGSYRAGEHIITGVDPGSGESKSFLQVVDSNGKVLRISEVSRGWAERRPKFTPPASEDLSQVFASIHSEGPGMSKLTSPRKAEEGELRAGDDYFGTRIPGEDLSDLPVCERMESPSIVEAHIGCKTQLMGRSIGTQFHRAYTRLKDATLCRIYWEDLKNKPLVHSLDKHCKPTLVVIKYLPDPSEYAHEEWARELRVEVYGVRDPVRVSPFSLYRAEVIGCGCHSPWDGPLPSCEFCFGRGELWRHRLHPGPLAIGPGSYEPSYAGYARVPVK